jgi:hypothetical protein
LRLRPPRGSRHLPMTRFRGQAAWHKTPISL